MCSFHVFRIPIHHSEKFKSFYVKSLISTSYWKGPTVYTQFKCSRLFLAIPSVLTKKVMNGVFSVVFDLRNKIYSIFRGTDIESSGKGHDHYESVEVFVQRLSSYTTTLRFTFYLRKIILTQVDNVINRSFIVRLSNPKSRLQNWMNECFFKIRFFCFFEHKFTWCEKRVIKHKSCTFKQSPCSELLVIKNTFLRYESLTWGVD